MLTTHENPEGILGIMSAIGLLVGLGKLLSSSEKLTPRLVVGRALVHAGLGAAAGGVTFLFPNANPFLLYATAAGVASLGSSAIEALVEHYIGRRK